ncbi:OsmC family protein [Anaerobranca gottschalkii]|uniref:Putative redox protein n=1 Tax=Anaerobranca gottschalkii DSM 13577 TaxID=1120990 RepID=A0A1H9YUC7_9FIRM|nr:OsmC family protein [Anaerobranca gottschalkii]SES72790.1 putative redox protein [Anaerobranca gottschalkii DSM 13577]
MEEVKTKVIWQGEKKFVGVNQYGSTLDMNLDLPEGIKPTQMALIAIGGCTAIDVISTLEKMRQKVISFEIEIAGVRRDEHPRYFEEITLVYKFKGELDPQKVEKAIKLSKEKYCSVSNMFEPKAKINYKFEIES